jgi:HK97 gp10 family phage protein
MAGGTVIIRGLENVIRNMEQVTPELEQRLDAATKKAGDVLEKTVKEFAEIEDHTLKELAEMGHPYSYNFSTDAGPHPDEIVHRQSGKLYDNIEKIVRRSGRRFIVACGVDENKVEYIKYLINGTSKMRSRDFLGWAWLKCRNEVLGIIKHGLALGSRRGIYGNRSSKVK